MTEFRELLERHGISQAELSRRFGIPIRTVAHWASGDRDCPDYTLRMIDELLKRNAKRKTGE